MSRYEMWAGICSKEWIKWVSGMVRGKHDPEPKIDAIWPIIDRETCGEISMEPRPEQVFCFAMSNEAQRIIYDALKEAGDE